MGLEPLISTWPVEQAALAVLREWLPTYMAETEAQEGMALRSVPRPPGNEFYYGGLDFESEIPGELPVVIVVVKPDRTAEKSARAYVQAYELKVGAIVIGDSEEEARMRAGVYGSALLLLGHIGSLGGLATETTLIQAAKPEWVSAEQSARRMIRSVLTYQTLVTVLDRDAAPAAETLADAPEVGGSESPLAEKPTVETVGITVTPSQGD